MPTTAAHWRTVIAPVALWAVAILCPQAAAQAPPEGRACTAEPTNMSIDIDDVISCNIDALGDSDTFRFSGQSGELVSIQVTRQGGGEPQVELFNPAGTRVAGPTVAGCCSQFARVDFRLTATGTHSIRVSDWGSDATMPYLLVLHRLGPVSASATPIVYGNRLTGEINPKGDVDLYTFTSPGNEKLLLQLTRNTGGEAEVELLDPTGARVAGPVVSGCCSQFARIDFPLVNAGSYTIRVSDWGSDAPMTFLLAIDRISPPSPTSTRLQFDLGVDGDVTPKGDSDYYTFWGSAGSTLTIQATRRGGGEPEIQLFSPEGVSLAGPQPSGCCAQFVRLDRPLTATGDYSIRVTDWGSDAPVAYRLEVQCLGACDPPINTCAYSLAPASQVVPAVAGTGTIGVFTSPGCSWTATSSAAHVSIVSGSSGSGPGAVGYSITPNSAASSRTAALTVAGRSASITQSGSAPLLILSPNSLVSVVREGSTNSIDQVLSVFTNAASLNFSATAAGGSWLTISPTTGAAPASVVVSVNPRGLSPGKYAGTVTFTAPTANPSSVTMPVNLTVEPAGDPRLSLESGDLTFAFAQGATQRTVRGTIANIGGGTLSYEARASSVGNWLRVSPDRGQAKIEQPASLTISADPSGLSPGTYQGSIEVIAGSERRQLAVTMTISQVRQSMLLSQTGLTYIGVVNGGAVPSQGVGVLNLGQGVMDWSASASTLTGGSGWLSVSPASGATDASSLQVPQFDVNVNPAALAPGEYHGLVRVDAATADNSPQFVSVVLQVLPAGSDPGPVVRPTGLIFTGIAGGSSSAAQPVRIANLTSGTKTFTSGRLTIDGGSWLASTPTTGSVAPAQPVALQVSVNTSGLSPGIRRGVLTLLFADGAVRTVNILLVLSPGAASGNSLTRNAEGCTASRLLPLVTSLGSGFTVPAGWPNPIEVRVVDDCGNALTNGSVVATFSNGDAPIPLVSLKDGRWVRDWVVKRTDVAQVTVAVTAEDISKNIAGRAEVSGGFQANLESPVMATGGVLNAASFQLGGPVAVGGMVSLFGSRLSRGEGKSPNLPLQTELAGTLATIGGKPMPLIVATEGQINAVVPYDLPVNTQVPVIVRQGNRYTVPEMVTVAPAQPAVFTRDGSGKGQGIIINSAGRIAEPGQGAAAGSAIVIYCTGLGPVTPGVEAGRAAPVSPLSRTTNEVTVTIGGSRAEVVFAGLVPGFTGFYQINAVVPAGATGDAIELVVTVAGLSSPPITIALK